MDQTRNSRSWQAFLASAEAGLRDYFVARPLAWWEAIRGKLRDLPKTNFDLGTQFVAQELWKDAIFRFRMALYLKPGYPGAWFNLGCCYFRLNRKPQARDALKKALAQDPANRDAIYMLTAVDAESVPAHLRPTRMPKAMVTQYFGQAAPLYDAMELQNQYQGGQLVYDAVKPLARMVGPSLVDLGCGTGIASRPWRALASNITGVDCTKAMEAAAAGVAFNNVKLFDRVVEADIGELGEALPAGATDIVLCINTAGYVGDLAGLLQGAFRLLKTGGFFVLTTEPFAGRGPFGLVAETGRFGHTPDYVRRLAATTGFTMAREQRLDLYPDTPSQLQVLARP